jgi:hypothetical protein
MKDEGNLKPCTSRRAALAEIERRRSRPDSTERRADGAVKSDSRLGSAPSASIERIAATSPTRAPSDSVSVVPGCLRSNTFTFLLCNLS